MTNSPQTLRPLQSILNSLQPWAPLVIRLTLGVVFMAHGLDKLFGCFTPGSGLEATTKAFAGMGFAPAGFMALSASMAEAVGGLLVFLGLLTRLGGLLIAVTMVVAIVVVHWSGGLFAHNNGFEYPMVALGGALSLVCSGGGAASVDAWLMALMARRGCCGVERPVD